MSNTIFIIIGLVVLIIFFFSVAVIHIRSLRDDIDKRWYNLADKLEYRQDMVPNLIETARLFIPPEQITSDNDLIAKTIETRANAGKNVKLGSDKIIQEHDLSKQINDLFALGQKYEILGKSTNYLELKKEFKDINAEIEKLSHDFNDKVRHHNGVISRPYNIVPSMILGFKRLQIFEFE